VTEAQIWSQGLPRVDVAWERASATVSGLRGPVALDVAPFAAPSRFVTVDANRLALFELATRPFEPGRPVVEATTAFCSSIFESFAFDSSFTEVSTPLDVVLAERRGVCQDFAHLAVGCLRTLVLAARYVSGYIETDPPPGEPTSVGADASHAWVSVYCPDYGWVDADPTNGIFPSLEHVTLGWGRDYDDVIPLRGVLLGGGDHELEIKVTVAPAGPMKGARSIGVLVVGLPLLNAAETVPLEAVGGGDLSSFGAACEVVE